MFVAFLSLIEVQLFLPFLDSFVFVQEVIPVADMQKLSETCSCCALLFKVDVFVDRTATAFPTVLFCCIQLFSQVLWTAEVSLFDLELKSQHRQFLVEDGYLGLDSIQSLLFLHFLLFHSLKGVTVLLFLFLLLAFLFLDL